MGFFDYLRMMMGWWNVPPATPLVGPLCFTVRTFVPGSHDEDTYAPDISVKLFQPGSTEFEQGCDCCEV